MTIIKKQLWAATLAVALMFGNVTTCFAMESENIDRQDTIVSDQAISDMASPETEETKEELPYDITVDDEGNYTFSFGDWEWSSEETKDSAVVNDKVKSYLNLRSGSGTEYDIIGHLLPGEEVQIVSDDGNWYKVIVPEKTGYVYKDYLDKLDEANKSGQIDEEFMSMMIYLMMMSMEQQNNTALSPDGNMTLVDDIGPATGEGQQFITLVTKAGNYFYMIIDRNDKGEENVHFLNLVDEADLFALMDEDTLANFETSQNAENAGDETPTDTTEDTVTPPLDVDVKVDTENEKNGSMSLVPLAMIVLIVVGAGGVYLFIKNKKKKVTEIKPDPDVDYNEEDDYCDILDEEDDGSYNEDNSILDIYEVDGNTEEGQDQ